MAASLIKRCKADQLNVDDETDDDDGDDDDEDNSCN